jgi:nitrous oxide reductase accessory protein NosL
MKLLKGSISSPLAVLYLLMHLLCMPSFSFGENAVENPKYCSRCGMDRTVFAKSRMLIVYEDGTAVGVCSIHCAAAEMNQNSDRKVKSLTVADYLTKEMIDAKVATWVIGGNKEGVMTSVAKWAFAKEEEAKNFVKENGGKVASFDQVMRAADEEAKGSAGMTYSQQSHMGHDMSQHMGPGAQMIFNPGFGDDIYHTHPAGMWMLTYKLMHMNMSGLRSGTSDVDLSSIGFKRDKTYNYMMIPTDMTMDMHMFMVMYGITDRLTVMAMANYQVNSMGMLMDMGPKKMITREDPMTTRGLGDTEIRGIYKINKYLNGSLGLSLPTGDINQTVVMMRKTYRAPYDMQLGSGTYDLKPALTYNALSDDAKWNWGAQVMYTYHIGENKNDYSLGDNFKATGWLQRALGPLSSWVRLAFNDTGRIHGKDPEIEKLNHPLTGMGAPTPDADPDNYGGQRLDGLVGLSCQKGSLSFGVEGGVPLYQNLNGLQMKTKWIINAGVQIMF